MRLRQFRVRGFRCVVDSGVVPVKDLVSLIGRNESGKTSMLQALALLNKEAVIKKVDVTDGLEETVMAEGFRMVEATFALNAAELDAIRALAPDVPDDLTTVTIFRTFGSKQPLYDFGDLQLPKVGIIRREFLPEFQRTGQAIIDKLMSLPELLGSMANVDIVQQLKLKELLDEVPTLCERIDDHIKEVNLSFPAITETLEFFGELMEVEVLANLLLEDLENFKRLRDELFQEVEGIVALSDLIWRKFHPRFVYFSSYKVIHGAVKISDYLARNNAKAATAAVDKLDSGEVLDKWETIDNLFFLAKLDPKEMQALSGRITELNKFLLKASHHLTEAIQGTWVGEDTNFEAEFVYGDDVCRIKISDLHADGTRTNQQLLQRRSEGFRWNFSFQVNFNAEIRKADLQEAILLLDEPGMHLHPSQQHSFVRGIKRLSQSNQVLYTTHSPFMIWNFDPGHLLLVETDPRSHLGRVTEEYWRGNLDGIVPILHAMGEKLLEHRFTEVEFPRLLPPVVLVERRSDMKFLKTFNALLREPPSQGTHSFRPIDVEFVPCCNLSAIAPHALYHRHIGQRCAVIFSGAAETAPYKAFLLERKFPAAAILALSEGLDFEDLIEETVYMDAVNEVYRFQLRHTKFRGVSARMLQKARSENPEVKRITRLLEWIWSRKQGDGWGEFNRELVCDRLCAQFLESGEAPEATVRRFHDLFVQVDHATRLEDYVFSAETSQDEEL